MNQKRTDEERLDWLIDAAKSCRPAELAALIAEGRSAIDSRIERERGIEHFRAEAAKMTRALARMK